MSTLTLTPQNNELQTLKAEISKMYYQPRSKDELLTCGCGAKISQKMQDKHLKSTSHKKRILKLMIALKRKINPNPTEEVEIKNLKDILNYVKEKEHEGIKINFTLGTDFKIGMIFSKETADYEDDAGFGYYDSAEENTDDEY